MRGARKAQVQLEEKLANGLRDSEALRAGASERRSRTAPHVAQLQLERQAIQEVSQVVLRKQERWPAQP